MYLEVYLCKARLRFFLLHRVILKHFPAVTISSVNVAPSRKCNSNVGLSLMLHWTDSEFTWLHTIQCWWDFSFVLGALLTAWSYPSFWICLHISECLYCTLTGLSSGMNFSLHLQLSFSGSFLECNPAAPTVDVCLKGVLDLFTLAVTYFVLGCFTWLSQLHVCFCVLSSGCGKEFLPCIVIILCVFATSLLLFHRTCCCDIFTASVF